MSEELNQESLEELNSPIEELDDDEFEEISSDEVDSVVAQLETIIESVSSENIKTLLEDALNSVYFLVYDESDLDDELEDGEDEILADAA
ncbi:MAG: hypothetical protein Tsb009_31370 [Planctomycetaceae bacterium]